MGRRKHAAVSCDRETLEFKLSRLLHGPTSLAEPIAALLSGYDPACAAGTLLRCAVRRPERVEEIVAAVSTLSLCRSRLQDEILSEAKTTWKRCLRYHGRCGRPCEKCHAACETTAVFVRSICGSSAQRDLWVVQQVVEALNIGASMGTGTSLASLILSTFVDDIESPELRQEMVELRKAVNALKAPVVNPSV